MSRCCALLFVLSSYACGPGSAATPVDAGSGVDATVPDASPDAATGGSQTIQLSVDGARAIATHTEHYLSFTVDTDRLITVMPWDSPRLRRMTQELAPAIMRVGGSKADLVYYDLSDDPVADPPAPYRYVMTKAQFDAACDFATAVGLEIMFTLNAGDGPRDLEGRWTPDAARALVEHAQSIGCPVTVWELGNEVSSFAAADIGEVSPEQYGDDFVTARAMLDDVGSTARLGGPASFYLAGMGEATFHAGFLPESVAAAHSVLDIVTWHYYPTQATGCGLGIPTGTWDTLLQPRPLDDVLSWAAEVEQARDDGAPGAEVWLDETGHAVCGGQEEVSDRFVAGLWWLDELGQLARRDQQVIARQSLTGGDYHLMENDTLVPYPDYFNSVLWRRLMGAGVLARPEATVTEDPTGRADPSLVRLYAQCTPDRPGAVTVLAINLSQDLDTTLAFANGGATRELYLLTADDPVSEHVSLNDTELAVAEDGSPPAMDPVAATDVVLPPISYAFVVLPDAAASACP